MVYSSYNDLLQSNFESLNKERDLNEQLSQQIVELENKLKQQIQNNEESISNLTSQQNITKHLDDQNIELTNENLDKNKLIQQYQQEIQQAALKIKGIEDRLNDELQKSKTQLTAGQK